MDLTRLVLKSGKDQSVKRLHPWIFSGAIKKIYGQPQEGELVKVYSNKDEFLGIGHYQIGSIAVRIISFKDIEPDSNFWNNKIIEAYNYRKYIGLIDNKHTNVYRLINAEGDGMPGLIVDYYNGIVVIQIHSIGMSRIIDQIVGSIKDIYKDKLISIYNKSESTLPHKADIQRENSFLFGNTSTIEVLENNNKFHIDIVDGQKTGFFIDQRENRNLVKQYSKDRNVLNVFGYTGGFSVYAINGGAKLVHTVDSSAKAIDLCTKNIEANTNNSNIHKGFAKDAFTFLDEMDEIYDVIILDPPAFAKHHNVLPNALQGYKRINAKAIKKIKKGGILFTFSCSQAVSKENFRKSVFTASANIGRNVRILHQLSQPIDHPVNIYHPEGEYLKGLVLHIE